MFRFKPSKYLWLVLLLIVCTIAIRSGTVNKVSSLIKEQIESYMNNDGLQNLQGQKFSLNNKSKHIFIYTELDCTDFALEKNKIILSYNWREFIARHTEYKVILALKLLNETEAGAGEVRSYIGSLNTSLRATGKDELIVCIDPEGKFREKYQVPYGSHVIAFADSNNPKMHKLDSFYMHLYSAQTFLFLERLHPIFAEMLKEPMKEPIAKQFASLNTEEQELEI